jgi:hypothetical protein
MSISFAFPGLSFAGKGGEGERKGKPLAATSPGALASPERAAAGASPQAHDPLADLLGDLDDLEGDVAPALGLERESGEEGEAAAAASGPPASPLATSAASPAAAAPSAPSLVLTDLPDDLLVLILAQLDPPSLIRTSAVSRPLRRLALAAPALAGTWRADTLPSAAEAFLLSGATRAGAINRFKELVGRLTTFVDAWSEEEEQGGPGEGAGEGEVGGGSLPLSPAGTAATGNYAADSSSVSDAVAPPLNPALLAYGYLRRVRAGVEPLGTLRQQFVLMHCLVLVRIRRIEKEHYLNGTLFLHITSTSMV